MTVVLAGVASPLVEVALITGFVVSISLSVKIDCLFLLFLSFDNIDFFRFILYTLINTNKYNNCAK